MFNEFFCFIFQKQSPGRPLRKRCYERLCYIPDSCFPVNFAVFFNSFVTEVPVIQKPVHWFAEQINGLVSISWDLRHESFNEYLWTLNASGVSYVIKEYGSIRATLCETLYSVCIRKICTFFAIITDNKILLYFNKVSILCFRHQWMYCWNTRLQPNLHKYGWGFYMCMSAWISFVIRW